MIDFSNFNLNSSLKALLYWLTAHAIWLDMALGGAKAGQNVGSLTPEEYLQPKYRLIFIACFSLFLILADAGVSKDPVLPVAGYWALFVIMSLALMWIPFNFGLLNGTAVATVAIVTIAIDPLPSKITKVEKDDESSDS